MVMKIVRTLTFTLNTEVMINQLRKSVIRCPIRSIHISQEIFRPLTMQRNNSFLYLKNHLMDDLCFQDTL